MATIRKEIVLQVQKGKSFYKVVNKATDDGTDIELHKLARIEPHSRQKIGDEIVVMLEMDSSRPLSEQGHLYLVPKGTVHWGVSGVDEDATVQLNIRVAIDLYNERRDVNTNNTSTNYAQSLGVRCVDCGMSTFSERRWKKPKLFKLLWDGSDWIMTTPAVILDMYS